MIVRFYQMNIRMLALDVDGTLLGKNGLLSRKTRNSISSALASGLHVALCTGRHHADALAYASELGINSAIVAGNGALAVDRSRTTLFARSLPLSKVIDIETILIAEELQGIFYTHHGVFLHPGSPVEQWYSARDRQLDGALNLRILPLISPALRDSADEVYKIAAVSFNADRLQRLDKTLSKLPLSITQSAEHNLEIMEHGTTKALALGHLLKEHGLTFSNLMAIGDGLNDIDMIRNAEVGVAMGNAAPELKELSDHIAPPNTEDGVADIINSLLKKEGIFRVYASLVGMPRENG